MNLINLVLEFIFKLLGIKRKPTVEPQTTDKPPEPEQPKLPPEPKVVVPQVPAIHITGQMMKTTLHLGHLDHTVAKEDVLPLLKQYHQKISDTSGDKDKKLRHSDSMKWVDLKTVDSEAEPVKAMQTFLFNAGIFPEWSILDGFFGYGTLAGVRLFQEYNRIYEGKEDLLPTGVVDKATWEIMEEWQKLGKRADRWDRNNPGIEFKMALKLLNAAREHYVNHPHFILDLVDKKVDAVNTGKADHEKVDTFKVTDWTYNEDDIHLVGIRRKEDSAGTNRRNDDLFILLINGMVFLFWGSTDPNRHYAKRTKDDEPFITEGQHKFGFGWHMHSSKNESYQGLNPFSTGVLVFRDKHDSRTNKLTEADLKAGIDDAPNTTINIHWTGDGASGSWSAGCQVIAGDSYIDNFNNEQQFPNGFVPVRGSDFKRNKVDKVTKSKGAYNIFTDLILLYAPKREKNYLLYTLGRDETFDADFLQGLGLQERLDKTIASFGLAPDPDDIT